MNRYHPPWQVQHPANPFGAPAAARGGRAAGGGCAAAQANGSRDPAAPEHGVPQGAAGAVGNLVLAMGARQHGHTW